MPPARQGAATARTDEARSTVNVEPDGAGGAVVVLAGEIDQDRAAEVQDILMSALGAHPAGVVLDLAAVTFCDCSCLNVLLHARLKAGAGPGRRFKVRNMSARVARLLTLTDTLAYFPNGDGPADTPQG
ncbi:STAS domain-containing protein [Streptomyces sp. NPDC085929]|uniref:STAS domain-containing protein n=1 Tax=Streptomyces sp. NPDC085929 TaxID=3365739 RepID=UPI0037D4AF82